MLDRDAEGEGADGARIDDPAAELLHHEVHARLVAGVQLREVGVGVAAAGPAHAGEVRAVGDAEVLEGDQELAVEGVPEAKLGSDRAVEIAEQRLAVEALGGRGEAEQDVRAKEGDQALVGLGRRVVALVEDDVDEVVGRDALGEDAAGGLHGGEDVVPALGDVAVEEQLAEGAVVENVAKRGHRLVEELAAVGDEQQARRGAGALGEPRIVEGGDDRLARPGGGDDEVAPAAVDLALHREVVENLLLVGERADGEERGEDAFPAAAGALGAKGAAEAIAVRLVVGIVRLELGIVPEAGEGAAELVDDLREVGGAHLDHPLVAGTEGGGGEVRGADVRGVELGLALEEPGLGVEAGAARVVGDLHLGIRKARERVDGFDLGGAGEDGGEDAQLAAASGKTVERGGDGADAAQADEGGEDVDAIGALDLAADLVREGRLRAIAREERADGERRRGATRRGSLVNRGEKARRRKRRLVGSGKVGDAFGDDGKKARCQSETGGVVGERSERGVKMRLQVPREPLGLIGRIDVAKLGAQRREGFDGLGEATREQTFVEAAGELHWISRISCAAKRSANSLKARQLQSRVSGQMRGRPPGLRPR